MQPRESGLLTRVPPRARVGIASASWPALNPMPLPRLVRVAVTAEGLLDEFYSRFVGWYNATAAPQGATPISNNPADWQSPGIAELLGCEPARATEWLRQFYESQADAELDAGIAESLHSTSRIINLLARRGVSWHVLIARHGQHEAQLREWLLLFYQYLTHDRISLLEPYDSNAHTIDAAAMREFCDDGRISVLIHNEPRVLTKVCTYESGITGILAGPAVGWIDRHTPDYANLYIRRVAAWRDMPRALNMFLR